ncbi:MAG: aminotransferase class I/II-fold pyridoxal phosphate-dependent enzyme [Anaerolineales bacterium]
MTYDQSRVPLVEAVSAAQRAQPISFHMPGHKFNPTLLPEIAELFGAGVFTGDLNEIIPDLDNLHAPTGSFLRAQSLAAAAVGAERTFFLVNGSTAGNQAMLMAAARDGDTVIVPRAAHRSTYAGLILSGAKPIYAPPQVHPQVGFPLGIKVEAVAQCFAHHPEAVALHITSPNYYGYTSDVATLTELAHARDAAVLVDEAHGAHFPFHPALPPSAVSVGADLVVQSAHKTLGALTQAAWLHLTGDRLPASRVQHVLSLLKSSSPSVLLTSSLDAARRQMSLHGERLLTDAIERAQRARATIREIPGLWCYGAELVGAHGIAGHDPTKLVIRVSDAGWTGTGFAEQLWARFTLSVEFADPRHIIASISIADDDAKIDKLLACLRAIVEAGHALADDAPRMLTWPGMPPLIMSPRQATFARSCAVPLAGSVGRVCAEPVIPYPPGVPILMPGELIERELVEYVRELLALRIQIVGPEDRAVQTLRVVVTD